MSALSQQFYQISPLHFNAQYDNILDVSVAQWIERRPPEAGAPVRFWSETA